MAITGRVNAKYVDFAAEVLAGLDFSQPIDESFVTSTKPAMVTLAEWQDCCAVMRSAEIYSELATDLNVWNKIN